MEIQTKIQAFNSKLDHRVLQNDMTLYSFSKWLKTTRISNNKNITNLFTFIHFQEMILWEFTDK